ncbi:uncharacterized protein LTR77_004876 [Saxophila tyrrhenica]|uniref:PLC-like phosphodiesterase n=1 Tax=Saxophila tyrrhenica TaxID=1690608 RepID=A0AAV9PAN6_9PEZI|nr:hypothetical protein LTR77_004876 [Saxophila tyrrhenica]
MLFSNLATFLLLPAAIRAAAVSNSTGACNNSPSLCSKPYDQVTYLGAHDSPFLRDESTDFSTSGNQYYNSTVQLSAGVRLLTAQVQNPEDSNALHVCHTSCDLLDAGTLRDWLAEVRTWMESNPNEVVTLLLVNGAEATGSALTAQYEAAGLASLSYTPSGSSSTSQDWPTLQTLIDSGTRLINFVPDLNDDSGAAYLMNQWNYVFENDYENTSPTDYSCEVNRPANFVGRTSEAISKGRMPLMNHFLYAQSGGENSLFTIQEPNATYTPTTNGDSGTGNLETAADACKQEYGRAPSFILTDFFNVGPAIATVDRLNGVSNPVGRRRVSTANEAPSSGAAAMSRMMWGLSVPLLCAYALL